MAQITTGAPQGPILGPFLFLTYVNDFVNTSTLFSFVLFADNTTSISKIIAKKINRFNKELDKLFKGAPWDETFSMLSILKI